MMMRQSWRFNIRRIGEESKFIRIKIENSGKLAKYCLKNLKLKG